LPDYAELHCLSNYSFLRGASHPAELVERAARLGYRGLAITDQCSLAGVVRAHVAVLDWQREHPHEPPLQLLIGSELHLSEPDGQAWGTVLVLACNRNGYGNLSELITLARRRAPKGSYRLTPQDLSAPEGGAAHLAGLPDCVLILVPDPQAPAAHTLACAQWLAGWAGSRAWLALELWQHGDDAAHLAMLRRIAAASGLPLVAAGGALMHARSRKALQDTLTAIRLNTPLAQCGLALQANAERHLRTRARLAELYPADTLAETVQVAARCRFVLSELRYEYPREIIPAGATPASRLRELVYQGAAIRWPQGLNAAQLRQIEHELALIAELHYEPYFLTVHDIVAFARRRGILCQGRGSAANSVVCYCLHITEIDPVLNAMLVERFISRARGEPPDIDVDFEHQRREEVIQYLYEKYGRHRAALTGALITYRSRSAIRDVGKALGLDADVLERLAQNQQWWDGRGGLVERFGQAGLAEQAPVTQRLAQLAGTLIGFPRHLSQHTGGFVIARDNLSRLVPVENAAMDERSVIEWDKDDLDAIGLLKVDVLALGMLSAIRRSLELVAQRRGLAELRWQDIPREDAATYEMMCHADTIGVFQIESRAQQSMLPRLRPRRFYDLVIEVALVRPGPIQGGMVHPYLRRRQGAEKVEYLREEIKPALERTLGIPIFQEQVMQVAMLGAGFSAEDADALRRAMAAWRRKGNLHHFQERLARGLLANGYDADFAARICKQIEGFGDYGFPESHAASFALLVYTSSWLKRHEPAAFLAGLLNSQPLGFYSPAQLVQDAQRHGVTVLPVDVTCSAWEATLEWPQGTAPVAAPALADPLPAPLPRETAAADSTVDAAAASADPDPVAHSLAALRAQVLQAPATYGQGGPTVRLGLALVSGFSQQAAERIMAARQRAPLLNVDDLARRAALSRRELEALAAADALQALAGHRRQAWWDVTAQQPVLRLLRDAPIAEAALNLPAAPEGQEIVADYASLGLTLKRHPLALLRPRLAALRFKSAAELADYPNGRLARACGIVTVRQRPGTANGTIFVSLEDESGAINVIVWNRLAQQQRTILLRAQLLGVYGVWQREGEVMHLIAKRLVDQSPLLGSLSTRSRDFH
jgi:error-prone DNA polymerase